MAGAVFVTFTAPSTAPQCITITLLDDDIYEGDETFTATISSVSPGGTIGTQDTTTITIVDNDSKFNCKHTHTHAYARTHAHTHAHTHTHSNSVYTLQWLLSDLI